MSETLRRPGISFCSTCKNRLWQLRQTLPRNLEAIREDGCAELVLVNYNSADELDVFVRAFGADIRDGTLRYVHERTEPLFHCSKAKNLAHFASSGEFVVNLDADNFIGDTIPILRELWREDPNRIIQGFCGDLRDGTFGRIGLARRHFIHLGGYDEEFLPIGRHDGDLILRAKAYGLSLVRIKQEGMPAVRNSVEEKMRYAGNQWSRREMLEFNSARMEENLRLGRWRANPGRQPVPVLVNFVTEMRI